MGNDHIEGRYFYLQINYLLTPHGERSQPEPTRDSLKTYCLLTPHGERSLVVGIGGAAGTITS